MCRTDSTTVSHNTISASSTEQLANKTPTDWSVTQQVLGTTQEAQHLITDQKLANIASTTVTTKTPDSKLALMN